jgi:hypothetical protein
MRGTSRIVPVVVRTMACAVDFVGRFASGLVAKAGKVRRVSGVVGVDDLRVCMSRVDSADTSKKS